MTDQADLCVFKDCDGEIVLTFVCRFQDGVGVMHACADHEVQLGMLLMDAGGQVRLVL